ncbi:MAG: PEP-utilizing enzyme [Patescibacteria group bacterium]|jgi:phosphohistidine swiveling domain-containing protein
MPGQNKFYKNFEASNSLFSLQMKAAIETLNRWAGEALVKDEFYSYKDRHATIFIYQDDVQRVRKYLFNKLKSNPSYLNEIYQEAEKRFKYSIQHLNTYKNEVEAIKDPASLRKWIGSFIVHVTDTTALGILAELFAGYDDFWVKYFRVSKEELAIIMAPIELGIVKTFEREIALLKLGLSDKNSAKLASDYQWILNNYRQTDKVTEAYILEQLKKISPDEARAVLDDIKSDEEKLKLQKFKFFKKVELTAEKAILLDDLASLVLLQDKRKEVILRINSLFKKVCRKLLDMYEVSDQDGELVLDSGFCTWFSDFEKHDLLTYCRMALEGFCWPVDGGWLTGKQVIEKYEKETQDEVVSQNDQIRGQAAYKGKIKGVAKIVLKNSDFEGFNQGDILVASMTRPEFIPLMKMASAIVTDEGGITCHAAIVAREMKKPCIIGTKIATKVLHDGDEVEVDADKGIVRIIKEVNS